MQERNNSDNEDTMLLPDDMDNYTTQHPANDLPPLKRKRPVRPQQYNGRQQNYGQQQYSRPQQNYGQQQYSRPQQNYGQQQYSRPQQNYEQQQYSRPQQNYGQQQYSRPQQNYGQQRPQSSQPNYHYYDDRNYDERQRYDYRSEVPRPAAQPPRKQSYSSPKKTSKRHHHNPVGRIIKRIFWSVFSVFLVIFALYSCTSLSLISKVDKQESASHYHPVGVLNESYVRSILVLGTDNRGSDEVGRSDSMILVSMNTRTHEFIMTSFMRDCYVEIPGYGWNKLNSAYAFGGPDLLMETIENNFHVRIDDYVGIDFLSFASIVDSVGGLDMDVSDEEAEEINNILISEVNELMGDDRYADLLEGGGFLHLNGKQALAYSRIRNVGNSDFERTSRQRRVIELIMNKIKTFRPSIFANIATRVIPDVSTNMSTFEMYLYSLRLPFVLGYERKQIQVPYDGTFWSEDVWIGEDCLNVLQVDFEQNYNMLKNDVFGTMRSVPAPEDVPQEEVYYEDQGY